jgi:hypothetical protein
MFSDETLKILSGLASIATVFGVAFAIAGLIFVAFQLRQGRVAREVGICLSLAQISGAADFQTCLNKVLALAPEGQVPQEAALRVCVFFELLGSICCSGITRLHLIEEFYGSLVPTCYDKLKSYIEDKRAQSNNKLFASNFEKLANRLR